MYTKTYFKLLGFTAKMASSVGVFSHTLNPKSHLFVSTPDLRGRVHFSLLLGLINTSFWCGSTIRMSLWGDGYGDPEFYMVYMFALASCTEYVVHVVIHWKEDDLAFAINQLILHLIQFKGDNLLQLIT